MKNPANTKKHWLVLLVVSLMVGTSIGLIANLNGIYYTPMAQDLNLLQGTVALQGTFLSLAAAFGALPYNKLLERFSLKSLIWLGAAGSIISTILLSFVNTVPLFYFLNILRGAFSALYSMVPMNVILNRWFHEKKGLAIGISSGMSGVVGAIAAPFFAAIIKESGWRMGFMLQSVAILILLLPALFFPFSLDPREEGLLPYGYNKKEKQSSVIYRTTVDNSRGAKITFFALAVIALLNTMVVVMNQHIPGYGGSIGLSLEHSSLMLSAVMVGSVVAKLSFGVLSDVIGIIKASMLMISLSILSILLLIFMRQPYILVFSSFLFGSAFSIGGVGLPILTNEFFDPYTAGELYSKISFMAGVGGALSVTIVGYIYDFTGSYIPAFVIGILFNLTNVVAILLANKYQPNGAKLD